MNFDDLLEKQRKSEPRVVLVMRIFTILIISSCFISYITILIVDVNDEIPSIKTSEVPAYLQSIRGVLCRNIVVELNQKQRKLRESLSILPLIDSSLYDHTDTAEEISVEEFYQMKGRLKSLEKLLREYVIDVKYLQSIEKNKQKPEMGETSSKRSIRFLFSR
ncbi:7592_t:CDS:2 [Funneliformis geosporum]|uniref:18059_t:CDS:1 n=1 Tax=Funneliformis geosporum TaxID=1117311 RepID=A0A9W4SIK3_9GLOM|nr:7592_t:CDS:2 [Funneliformis geosporum]CAI2168320.1 18059_t:CDS:2 [Funneliformis geosporum]